MSCDVGKATDSAHSSTFPSLHLRHSSFFNPSVGLPTSQLILQPFRCFTYVTVKLGEWALLCVCVSSAHSPNFPSLHLRHNSFFNPSVGLPTSQLILQPFRCFTYVTVQSTTLLSLLLRHKFFTYFTWRAAHDWWVSTKKTEASISKGFLVHQHENLI